MKYKFKCIQNRYQDKNTDSKPPDSTEKESKVFENQNINIFKDKQNEKLNQFFEENLNSNKIFQSPRHILA